MDRQRLTRKQADSSANRIWWMLHYLHRCRKRLDVRGFDANSEIYQKIDKAYCALCSLHVTLIYEACDHGVGRPRNDPPAAHASQVLRRERHRAILPSDFGSPAARIVIRR